jgi:hypothetical protein
MVRGVLSQDVRFRRADCPYPVTVKATSSSPSICATIVSPFSTALTPAGVPATI